MKPALFTRISGGLAFVGQHVESQIAFGNCDAVRFAL